MSAQFSALLKAPAPEVAENFRKAVVLIQRLLNSGSDFEHYAAEQDAKNALKGWGVKLPKLRDDEE